MIFRHRARATRFSRACFAVLGALLVLALLLPAAASAHPLGNFTINRYALIEADAEQVMLTYIVDMAEIPTHREQSALDANNDDTIDSGERTAYAESQATALGEQLILTVNGTRLDLEPVGQMLVLSTGEAGLPLLRLEVQYAAALPDARSIELDYRDGNFADQLGWQEVVVRPLAGAQLIESSAPIESISQGLSAYPDERMQAPPAVSSATATFRPTAGAVASLTGISAENASAVGASAVGASAMGSPVSDAADNGARDPFAELIALPELTMGAVLLALLGAFGWGAAHALSPGHGKTIVAAYLVGARGTTKHAIFLGLTTTLTHTAGVFTLGLITLFASRYILPEMLYPWLSLLSGLMVVGVGLFMLQMWVRRWRNRHAFDDGHDHGHGHAHSHGFGHSHTHGPGGHSHMPSSADGGPITWRNLLLLGVSGGLLPCPSALVVMLGAISLQRIGFGLILIIVFSLGLASVLTAIGIALVHAGRLVDRIPSSGPLMRLLPVGSAVFITLIGIGISVRAAMGLA